jgi:predicted nucleic acid-binding protein
MAGIQEPQAQKIDEHFVLPPTRHTRYLIDSMIVDRLYGQDSVTLSWKQHAGEKCVWIPSIVFLEQMKGWADKIQDNRNTEPKFGHFLHLMMDYNKFMRSTEYGIVPYSSDAISICGTLTRNKGYYDRRIAAIAKSYGFVVATGNVSHFSHFLSSDKIVDWTLDVNWEQTIEG